MYQCASRLVTMVLIGLTGISCRPVTSAEELTMLTALNYCPYEFMTELETGKSELVGFDIDIAKAIAARLGRPLSIEVKHFNQIMPVLDAQQADFAMAAITPTAHRRQMVDFSKIYYTQSIAIVSRKESNITSLESLIKKTVGVKAKSFQSQELTRYSDIQQIEFSTADELIAAVKAQRVDAGILDQAIAPKYVTPASQLRWFPGRSIASDAGVAIAFPKVSSPDVQSINTTLDQMQRDGTLTKLIHRWFDTYQCPES